MPAIAPIFDWPSQQAVRALLTWGEPIYSARGDLAATWNFQQLNFIIVANPTFCGVFPNIVQWMWLAAMGSHHFQSRDSKIILYSGMWLDGNCVMLYGVNAGLGTASGNPHSWQSIGLGGTLWLVLAVSEENFAETGPLWRMMRRLGQPASYQIRSEMRMSRGGVSGWRLSRRHGVVWYSASSAAGRRHRSFSQPWFWDYWSWRYLNPTISNSIISSVSLLMGWSAYLHRANAIAANLWTWHMITRFSFGSRHYCGARYHWLGILVWFIPNIWTRYWIANLLRSATLWTDADAHRWY